ncbi:MAG: hypothetical protein JW768_16410 [Chitinispirillaceae bacterium]|nr:hypothetical protein [Chitinispirillaceae bacterium]
MLIVLLIGAVIGVLVLCFYLVVEVNELEKNITAFTDKITKHYESR